MLVRVFGSLRAVSALHCLNAPRSMDVNVSGSVREVIPQQSRKTSGRKHVKLAGSVIEVREE